VKYLMMTSKDKPIRVHVYGPALRWNENNPDHRIPEIAVHPFRFDYRVMFLCDRVTPQAPGYPVLGSHPDDPLPAGEGGKVVVYMSVFGPLEVQSDDPWNWPKKSDVMGQRSNPWEDNGDLDWSSPPGPPRIFIDPTLTKSNLYRKVIQTYLRPEHQPNPEKI
jgi:hypothetical protein